MANPVSESRVYFLGVGGQQTGPHSEQEVIQKIKQGSLPPDTLVWYEGLPDWQPVESIEYFKGAVKATSVAPVHEMPLIDNEVTATSEVSRVATSLRSLDNGEKLSTFASSGEDLEPVFKGSEGVFYRGSIFRKRPWLLPAMGGVLVLGGLGYFFYNSARSFIANDLSPEIAPTAAPDSRMSKFRKANSELFVSPEGSIKALLQLILENQKDHAGQEAAKSLVEYYRRMQKPLEAGKLLLELKRYEEAENSFAIVEPPAHTEMESAMYGHYQITQGPQRRPLLIKDIDFLISTLNNVDLAIQRIKLLEQEFPGQPHPFGYYLKSPDEKISYLFSRTSFFFVQGLLGYINAELPQLNLIHRPLVEVRKEKPGFYRIVATYKGPISLNTDTLNDITFAFWQFNDNWHIVETNVTAERAKYARVEKEKHIGDLYPEAAMLTYLQSVFKQQFPKTAFHQTQEQKGSAKKNIVE